jgi:hypothetical protein
MVNAFGLYFGFTSSLTLEAITFFGATFLAATFFTTFFTVVFLGATTFLTVFFCTFGVTFLVRVEDFALTTFFTFAFLATVFAVVFFGTLFFCEDTFFAIGNVPGIITQTDYIVYIVYIDYLQLIKLDRDNRNEGLGQITRSLKSIAKSLDICIVIFSQLNRQVENRAGDRRPQLSDLKESGSIEEDSDVVFFLYRPEYYNISETDTGESTKGLIEVITSKNRQGGKESSFMRFLPTISTIVESREILDNNSMQNNSNIDSFENEVPQKLDSVNF